MDFASMAKKAQDALSDGADRIETALKDNSGKIEDAVDKAGRFAKEKFPDRTAQIDSATGKAKGVVPRHEDPAGPGTPPTTAPDAAAPNVDAPNVDAPAWAPPASATPEVDRAAAAATETQASSPAATSPTPEVDRVVRDQE